MKTLLFTAGFAALLAVPALAQVSPTQAPSNPNFDLARPPMMRESMLREHIEKMTPAQRAEMAKRAAARQAKWEAMSPEERDRAINSPEEQRKNWQEMPAEIRQQMEQEGQAYMQKLKALTPEQRAALQKQNASGSAWLKLSPEKRQRITELMLQNGGQPVPETSLTMPQPSPSAPAAAVPPAPAQ